MKKDIIFFSILFFILIKQACAQQQPLSRSIIAVHAGGNEVARIQLPVGMQADYRIHANQIENDDENGILRAKGNVQITLMSTVDGAVNFDFIGNELTLTKETLDSKKLQTIMDLERMGRSDQRYRNKPFIDAAAARLQATIDASNMGRLAEIIEQYGWPGARLVGIQASQNAFLVLQHANLEDQQKYLPLLRDAVDKNDALASELAMLEDRVRIGLGLAQLYGTQISSDGTLMPVDDHAQVDRRRAALGLIPLAEYLKLSGTRILKMTEPSAVQ
ncbi:hypothetical protein QN363_01570 [Undibacterium sp. CCC2.1]|nr:DUF6624 domain-containing protein [Undibacterium sp. CCC1.1]MEB0137703.1 hypothetical protein [Undibacterium sp. CCC2.1]MEB0172645.1 hypothetical protein [Undibacterium sp. CCC1.1]MEB0178216.1 hypothetical protein [Undibacterium sp. CCC3.4]